jgi:zinc-binding in reverse transcriptase
LVNDLAGVTLCPTPDISIWRWSASRKYSMRSMYEWLDFDGVISHEYDIVWNSKIPLKIRIFMWLVRKRKFLTKDNLVHRGWMGDTACVFCGAYEDIDHSLCKLSSSQ